MIYSAFLLGRSPWPGYEECTVYMCLHLIQHVFLSQYWKGDTSVLQPVLRQRAACLERAGREDGQERHTGRRSQGRALGLRARKARLLFTESSHSWARPGEIAAKEGDFCGFELALCSVQFVVGFSFPAETSV